MKKLVFIFFVIFNFTEFRAISQNLYSDTTVLEFRIEFSQPNWQTLLKNNVATESDIPATLIVSGVRYDSVGIRYKGNSSYNVSSDKKPFNISMDTYKPEQLLMGYKTLNLNNCFKDPTFVREKITYDLINKYLPSAKSAYIKLFINNEYFGLYLHVQQLNKTFLKEWFASSSGNHYKGDPSGTLQWLGTDTSIYKTRYELKTNEEENNWKDLITFIDKLNNLPQNLFADSIVKYLNVDRALWYIAFCNLYVNLDSYVGSGHNHYLYHNPTDDRFQIIPWDLNEVLGTFSQNLNVEQREQLSPFYKATDQSRPLVSKLLSVQEFKERYVSHYRTMFEETFNSDYWSPRISLYQNLILPLVISDTKKFYSIDLFSQNVNSNVQTSGVGMPGGTIPGLLSFITNRSTYLLSDPIFTQQKPVIENNISLSEIKALTEIKVTVKASNSNKANFWYSINGQSFNKIEMNSLGDNNFATTIAPQKEGTVVNYYVEAVGSNSARSYLPKEAEHNTFMFMVRSTTSSSPVVINELLASNISTNKDPQNEYDDWIELYNTTANPVNIGGKFLTDDKAKPTKWIIPTGTTVPAFGYIIVWADEDSETTELHANFKLSKSGEIVFYYDSTSSGITLLDSVTFGVQQDNISYGRIPNGTGIFQFTKPTPLAVNAQSVSVKENNLTPNEFSLFQNYPNPFNPSTTIKYDLPKDVLVNITIYNLLGQEVKTLVNGFEKSGFKNIIWDGTDNGGIKTSSGFYIYKIKAGSFSNIKKMILLK